MSLIICQECNYEYSEKAETCPNCNCPNPKKENEYLQMNKIDDLEISLGKDIRKLIQLHICSLICSLPIFRKENIIIFIQSLFLFAFVFSIVYLGYKVGYHLFGFIGGLLGAVAFYLLYLMFLEYLIESVNPLLGDIIVIASLFLYFLYQYIYPIVKWIRIRKLKKQILT